MQRLCFFAKNLTARSDLCFRNHPTATAGVAKSGIHQPRIGIKADAICSTCAKMKRDGLKRLLFFCRLTPTGALLFLLKAAGDAGGLNPLLAFSELLLGWDLKLQKRRAVKVINFFLKHANCWI